MKRIQIGPFNRVEGDLEIQLDIESGHVVDARIHAPLFRGFEQILIGHPAEDALTIVPRICGICSVAQSSAAALALASLVDPKGEQLPDNARLCRHLTQATENLADHLTHFYLFFMPDFARPAYADQAWFPEIQQRFTAIRGNAYGPVQTARANFMKLMGFLAGRWPHSLALQPGGSTHAITHVEKTRMHSLLRGFRQFLQETLFGMPLEAFSQLPTQAALENALLTQAPRSDLQHFYHVAKSLKLDCWGKAAGRFISYGAYDRYPAGIANAIPGETVHIHPLSPEKIAEDTHHAWLHGSGLLTPAQGATHVDIDKPNAYTWCKAPRYEGQSRETGALARQVIAGHPLIHDLIAQQGSNVIARVIARLIELADIVPAMEIWCEKLRPQEPFYHPLHLPESGQGVGLVEAARGGLGHWLRIERGRIQHYQIITPTTWNFSPKDHQNHLGPLESALIGLPVTDPQSPLIQHIVRSFDPCMACTVH